VKAEGAHSCAILHIHYLKLDHWLGLAFSVMPATPVARHSLLSAMCRLLPTRLPVLLPCRSSIDDIDNGELNANSSQQARFHVTELVLSEDFGTALPECRVQRSSPNVPSSTHRGQLHMIGLGVRQNAIVMPCE
jgi:hypothetical protein